MQRRYQNVGEVTPAVGLDCALRQRICDARYVCAALWATGRPPRLSFCSTSAEFYLIDVNPRIQVEEWPSFHRGDEDGDGPLPSP